MTHLKTDMYRGVGGGGGEGGSVRSFVVKMIDKGRGYTRYTYEV